MFGPRLLHALLTDEHLPDRMLLAFSIAAGIAMEVLQRLADHDDRLDRLEAEVERLRERG